MITPRLIYLSSAIDERTCAERSITTDSPAATAKVFGIAAALKQAGVTTLVLSLGRGRVRGTGRWYRAKAVRTNGIAVVYGPFFDIPVLTHLITTIGLALLIWRLRRRRRPVTVLAYNRLPHYIPALCLAKLIGFPCYVDIEDGDIGQGRFNLRNMAARASTFIVDRLCNSGAVLASAALASTYAGPKTICCYGVAWPGREIRDWQQEKIVVLFGGTFDKNQGADLFLAALEKLRTTGHDDARHLEFVVTGFGPGCGAIEASSADPRPPRLTFLGRSSRARYLGEMGRSHAGLSLKLKSGPLADTTFPSKVIEMAADGLLIVSTRISDVPLLFGDDGALLVGDDSPEDLASNLLRLAQERQLFATTALRGKDRILCTCAPDSVGQSLRDYLFDAGQLEIRKI